MLIGLIVVAVLVIGLAAATALTLAWRRIAVRREARRLAELGLTRSAGHPSETLARAARISPRLCPICRSPLERFESFGTPGASSWRLEARCPVCGSLERDRLGWLYLVNETDLFRDYEQAAVLNVSAERTVYRKLRQIGAPATLRHEPGAVTGKGRDGALHDYPTGAFDVVYCSYVLEHVPDDVATMRELCRVLKPTGWAVFQARVFRDETEELSPTEADAARGAPLRIYGNDFSLRLENAGFDVKADPYCERLGRELAERYGLMWGQSVYRCSLAAGTRR
jgi:SAM-dependent methyltransferase